jgi:hypothetical protein
VTVYLTNEQLKATLELTGTTFAEDDVSAAIEAASRGIEGACNRRFYPDADATQVRHYTPQTGSTCLIDDLITLTSLKVDRNGDGDAEPVVRARAEQRRFRRPAVDARDR